MSELSDLRNQIARMRKAATRKISRNKTQRGVDISGSEFDPRRSTSAPKNYTASQLRAYRNELAGFLSRENQFVPDATRSPLPRSEWEAYKRREQAYRDTAGSVYERVKNVELPSGESIQERMAKMDVLHKRMHNPTVNTIFDPHNRQPQDIVSREALKKLNDDLKQKANPHNLRRRISQSREQFEKMAEVVNEPGLIDAVKQLTHDQFVALWNYTNFASAVALSYDSAKKMLSPKEESWGHEMIRQQMADANQLIEWAKNL